MERANKIINQNNQALEKRFQAGKHILLDAIDNLHQKVLRRPSIYGGLAKDYQRGQVEIHTHLTMVFLREGSITNDFCLAFKWPSNLDIEAINFNIVVWRQFDILRIATKVKPSMRIGKIKCPMLVDIRQLIQHPQRLNSVVWPTVARLQSIDFCLCSWFNKTNRGLSSQSVFDGIIKDREFGISQNLRRDRLPTGCLDKQTIDKMIERRTQAIKTVTNQNRQFDGGPLSELEFNNVLTRMRVQFLDHSIRVSGGNFSSNGTSPRIALPPTDLRLQRIEVMLRAI